MKELSQEEIKQRILERFAENPDQLDEIIDRLQNDPIVEDESKEG